VVIETQLAPAWSSDWLTPAARSKLAAYGIAPPAEAVSNPKRLFGAASIECPRCHSAATRLVSEFGSTPCKAHYTCTACLEPFDYFKCI
jgi:ring-1,2-phenylacetyl-CoA epoxidase subunit PaaD